MKLGFIGSGMMARAIVGGLIDAALVDIKQSDIIASDKFEGCRAKMAEFGVKTTDNNVDVVSVSDVVVIAVKPNDIAEVLKSIHDNIEPRHVIVSIAAGVTTSSIEAHLPDGTRVVRVMPNTPALVSAMAAGVAAGSNCQPSDLDKVTKIFGSVGVAMAVDESKLDAVTGLSGSGPAYGFIAIEALADGGVRAGLSRDVALQLAAQTMLGAAKMVLETGQHPGVLKDQVCSPGGTTISGVHALEKAGMRSALIDAVLAAKTRASELGGK